MPRMSIAEIEALMDQTFPDWRNFSSIIALGERDVIGSLLPLPYLDSPFVVPPAR